tara:strand:+ start:298 stop:579 length:282 start_codon:yes stop_codon:yes gene_type:complete
MSEKSNKLRNQVKSRFYYLFWGIATFSVVTGQLYVGQGYTKMSKSFDKIFERLLIIVDDSDIHMLPKRMEQDTYPIVPDRGMGYWNSIIIPKS